MRLKEILIGVVISISVVLAVLLAVCRIVYIRRKCKRVPNGGSKQTAVTPSTNVNGVNSTVIVSDLDIHHESKKVNKEMNYALCWNVGAGLERKSVLSNSGLPSYSYRDLQSATKNFSTLIGQGAFGLVYKATLATDVTVAVKVLSLKSNQGEKEFLTEVTLLGRLHHRNLVNLLGFCTEKNHRILIYQYMENGSLARHLFGTNSEALSWNLRVQIAQDVSKGIEYLHDGVLPPVIHRDIKSSNVLLDGSMRARVADFGLSKEANKGDENSSIHGTLGYVDPEYILTHQYTEKSDVYSFGIFLFELITARSPQQGLLEYVNMAKISVEVNEGWEEILDMRLNGQCNIEQVGAMANLANRCLEKFPSKRPAIREVVQELIALQTVGREDISLMQISPPISSFHLSSEEIQRLPSIPDT